MMTTMFMSDEEIKQWQDEQAKRRADKDAKWNAENIARSPDWRDTTIDETGSEHRFGGRVKTFKESGRSVLAHHAWWLVHNCFAHPLIGIAPIKPFFDFHDFTSRKINGE